MADESFPYLNPDIFQLSELIRRIRATEMQKPETETASGLPQFLPLLNAENRHISDRFSSLLYVYGADGTEWSLSPQGRRLVRRTFPRQGWYHKHDYIELLYVAEGTFDQILLGDRLHFTQGEIIITDPNCEHADYIDAKDAAVLFLSIQTDFMDRLLKSYDGKDELQRFLFHSLGKQKREQSFLEMMPAAAPGAVDAEMDALLAILFREDLQRSPGYEKVCEGLLIRLLHRLCRDYTPQLHSSTQEGKEKAVLYEVERYIRLHAADVTIGDLENEFHYHRNYFNLLLKKYRDTTFKRYVQEVRLTYARQLLEQTDLPVHRIAQAAGYENTSFFYRLFEERFGCDPKSVRSGLKKGAL